MSRRDQIVFSTVAWCVLTALPGALAAAGVFGDLTGDVTQGRVIAVWIIGYLLQLGTMYLVVAAVGYQRQWWWFVSSLLPWAVDWGAPFGTLPFVASVAAVVVFAAAIAYTALRHLALTDGGRLVQAKVLKVLRNYMNVVINNAYIHRRVLLEIPAADGTTYQGKLRITTEIGDIPSVGDVYHLRVDPRNPRRYALDPTFERYPGANL